MYRYYYNINSSKKVLHLYGCHYLTNSKKKEYGEKHSLKKALNKGFTLCRHCFALQNRFFNEDKRISTYLIRYNYSCSCQKDCVEITTGNGRWKILYAENKQILELYHENKQIRSTDSLSRIQGYHDQKKQPKILQMILPTSLTQRSLKMLWTMQVSICLILNLWMTMSVLKLLQMQATILMILISDV